MARPDLMSLVMLSQLHRHVYTILDFTCQIAPHPQVRYLVAYLCIDTFILLTVYPIVYNVASTQQRHLHIVFSGQLRTDSPLAQLHASQVALIYNDRGRPPDGETSLLRAIV